MQEVLRGDTMNIDLSKKQKGCFIMSFKIPCGGFMLGEGLVLSEDGKTLSVSGGGCLNSQTSHI